MIQIGQDELIALKDVPALLPRRRRGRKPSFSCVLRWATKGLSGRRLEVLKVGATLCTSTAALDEFFRGLTDSDARLAPAAPALRTTAQRQRAIERADATLREAGVLGKGARP